MNYRHLLALDCSVHSHITVPSSLIVFANITRLQLGGRCRVIPHHERLPMSTGTSGKDHSKGNTNQPKGNSGPGSPRIQTNWPRKHNQGGKAKVNRKSVNVG